MIDAQYIAKLRKNQGWTQAQMAAALGISRATYIALEKMGSPNLTLNQVSNLANRLGVGTTDIISENILNEEKYTEVLLNMLKYGADDDGQMTKTKLAKLIYLADFAWFYSQLEPMTGAQYRRLDQGPVPNHYFRAIDELFLDGKINILFKDNSQLISLSDTGQQFQSKILNTQEQQLIQKIAQKWKGKRTSEIVDFTHQQLPYQICNPGEVIPYELITQQDPDYVY